METSMETSIITFTIKKLDSKKETITIDSSTKIEKVKSILSEKAGISKDQVRLIYRGTPMNDSLSLAQHKVEKDSVVHMILQMRG
jgi:large subunit ribosomal protein L40e